MKRLAALALILSVAAPAWAATYWVSPRSPWDTKDATHDGSDSTAAKALSLKWAITDTTAKTIRLMPGYYGDALHGNSIEPRGSGNAGTRLRFIGDITGAAPGNYVISGPVALDSSTTFGLKRMIQYVTVYGLTAQKLSVKCTGGTGSRGSYAEATSVHDSISYCVFPRGAWLQTVSDVTVDHCRIGQGLNDDRFVVADAGQRWCWRDDPCHCPDDGIPNNGTDCTLAKCGALYTEWTAHQALTDVSGDSAFWSTRLTITDNTMTLANNSGGNAMQFSWMKSSTYARNRHTIYINAAPGALHCNTWYDCQDNDVQDNYWLCKDNTASLTERYGLNIRDWQVANRWQRDTIYQDPGSLSPIKVEFMTSGAHPNTSHNNTYNGMVVVVAGNIGYQHRSKGDSHKFGTYFSTGFGTSNNAGFVFSNASSTDSSTVDSLVFAHNTVVSSNRAVALTSGYRLRASRVTKNIFASGATARTDQSGVVDYASTAIGVTDSNLVWSAIVGDSTNAIDVGGGTRYGLKGAWASTYGNDAASHWGTPSFTDSLWLRAGVQTFDPTPTQYSLAASSNLWGSDGFVGAKAGTGTDTQAPVVTLLLPDGLTSFTPHGIMDISWTATDNVSVSSVAIDYSVNGTTWVSVATGQAATGSYSWSYPLIFWSSVYVRVTATDGASLTGSATRRVTWLCSPCNDQMPADDPNRIPD